MPWCARSGSDQFASVDQTGVTQRHAMRLQPRPAAEPVIAVLLTSGFDCPVRLKVADGETLTSGSQGRSGRYRAEVSGLTLWFAADARFGELCPRQTPSPPKT